MGVAPASAQAIEVYAGPRGDTTGFSYRLVRPSSPPRGLLVVVGNWGNPFTEVIRQQLAVDRLLADSGVATLLLSNTPWRQNYFGLGAVDVLDSVIAGVARRLQVAADRIVVGGLQAGGTGAIQLARRCRETRCRLGGQLAGVFAVDPILDFSHFWRIRDVYTRGVEGPRTSGRRGLMGSMEAELGGPPALVPEVYRQSSPYDHEAPDGGNANKLVSTPIRVYVNPDLEWHLRQWGADASISGLTDQSGFILMLQRLGNSRAELIGVAKEHSVLPDGSPSPHAWRMIDEADLARWMLNVLRGP